MKVSALLLDFGGVMAEEGFHEGLLAIGRHFDKDPVRFFQAVERIIFDCGYLTGQATEADFWDAVRSGTGISGADEELRRAILSRFMLRPEMLAAADKLRQAGFAVAMLSDQTNWLDEIDRTTGLFGHFDRVFNSFHLHKSKRDPSVFTDVCKALGVRQDAVLFVDDNAGHIERARFQGLQTHHFTSVEAFIQKINMLVQWQERS